MELKPEKNKILIGELFKGKPEKALTIHVSSAFRKSLSKPKYREKKVGKEILGAYVFGKEFKSGYSLLSRNYDAEIGQTVLMDVTGSSSYDDLFSEESSAIWAEIYMNGVKNYKDILWDDPQLLKVAQKFISKKILFVGNHLRSRSRVLVLVHLNKKKSIDSLIINYGYYDYLLET